MATVRITYFSMDGEGRTMTDAKKDAGRKIEAAMSGSYCPRLLHSRGWSLVLWRDPYGWRHNTITSAGEVQDRAFQCYSSGYVDEDEALWCALNHLAQCTWDGAELVPPCLQDAPARLRPRLLSEFKSWRGFQLAYKAAPEGLAECERHRWACENGHKFAMGRA